MWLRDAASGSAKTGDGVRGKSCWIMSTIERGLSSTPPTSPTVAAAAAAAAAEVTLARIGPPPPPSAPSNAGDSGRGVPMAPGWALGCGISSPRTDELEEEDEDDGGGRRSKGRRGLRLFGAFFKYEVQPSASSKRDDATGGAEAARSMTCGRGA